MLGNSESVFPSRKVLITSSVGFIGSSLTRQLVELRLRYCTWIALSPNTAAISLAMYPELRVDSIRTIAQYVVAWEHCAYVGV